MAATVSTCVIFNPAAGRGKALRYLQEVQRTKKFDLELRPSQAPGHAMELAQQAAEEGFPLVVAAGGDGTVHEVANGVLLAKRLDTTFSVWPIGSANDYAYALGMQRWWAEQQLPLIEKSVDVGLVQAGNRSRFFVNCFGLGFNGGVVAESRRISWLRGLPLYTLAVLRALLWHFQQPNMRIQFDDQIRENPTLALTINLGQREGNFPTTPKASLEDGLFDVIHVGPIGRCGFLQQMPRMATGTLQAKPHIWMSQCQKVMVQSTKPVCIHTDGEFFCQPQDQIQQVQIELLPKRLKVQMLPAEPTS